MTRVFSVRMRDSPTEVDVLQGMGNSLQAVGELICDEASLTGSIFRPPVLSSHPVTLYTYNLKSFSFNPTIG